MGQRRVSRRINEDTEFFSKPLDIKHQNMLDAIRLRDVNFAEFEKLLLKLSGKELLNTIEERYKQVMHRKKK